MTAAAIQWRPAGYHRASGKPAHPVEIIFRGSIGTGGDPGLLTIQINNPDNNVALTDFSFSDVLFRAGTDGAIFEPTGAAATGSCVAAPVNASAVLQQGASAQVAVSVEHSPPGGSCKWWWSKSVPPYQ